MFQVKNVTIRHIRDDRILLKDFSLVLNDGDKAVMIGEEGNGKSTLMKWMHDPSLTEDYAEITGERLTPDVRSGYLPQMPDEEDNEKTVYAYLNEDMLLVQADWNELHQYLRELQLNDEMISSDRIMKSLSGGERIKVQMLRILLQHPQVLFLDEPSNDIDIHTLQWMEQFILSRHEPVLFISHDETLIENTADKVVHLEQIRRKTMSRHTVASVPYGEYVKDRDLLFERQRQQAVSDRREEQIRMEKFRKIEQRVNHELNAVSRQDPHSGRLLKKKMKAVKSMEKRFDRERENMTEMPQQEEAVMIFFDDVYLAPDKVILDLEIPELKTPDGKVLAENIFLPVRGRDKICIIGDNGCGKTTLMKEIYRQLKDRKDICTGYMPQEYDSLLDPEMTPAEWLAGDGDRDKITKVMTLLGVMKYTADEMRHPIKALSGGQQAKLLILNMILNHCDVLLLDEPTRNFSPLSAPVIRNILKEFGGCIISISHDRKYMKETADKVLVLDHDGLRTADEY